MSSALVLGKFFRFGVFSAVFLTFLGMTIHYNSRIEKNELLYTDGSSALLECQVWRRVKRDVAYAFSDGMWSVGSSAKGWVIMSRIKVKPIRETHVVKSELVR